MKRIIALGALVLILVPAACLPVRAQDEPPPNRRGDRMPRIERIKQMRLLEELNLSEDDAVRFMAKRKEHEDRMRALAEERNGILDDLGAALGAGPDGRGAEKDGAKRAGLSVEKAVGDVLDRDRKMFDERRRYQEEMRKMLPMEKFAKMLVFERQFQMQMRDAAGRSIKRHSKFDD